MPNIFIAIEHFIATATSFLLPSFIGAFLKIATKYFSPLEQFAMIIPLSPLLALVTLPQGCSATLNMMSLATATASPARGPSILTAKAGLAITKMPNVKSNLFIFSTLISSTVFVCDIPVFRVLPTFDG